MNAFIYILASLLIVSVIVINNLVIKNKSYASEIKRKEAEVEAKTSEIAGLKEEKDKAILDERERYKNDVEKLACVSKEQIQSIINEVEIKNRASMDEKKESLAKSSKDALEPMLSQLNELKTSVASLKTDVATSQAKTEQINKMAVESINQCNQNTEDITRMFRANSKVQGDWGERGLQNILEMYGMKKDVDFKTQETFTDEKGNDYRLDFLIRCPQDRFIVVDSKVTLTAYTDYVSAETEAEKKEIEKKMYSAIWDKVDDLSKKNYSKLDNRMYRQVLMYVSIEGALQVVLEGHKDLYSKAREKGIMIVSASTLIRTIDVIAYLWQQERHMENLDETIVLAEKLLDKFCELSDDFADIKKGIDMSNKGYENAINHLAKGRGNLISKADGLRKKGIAYNKSKSINTVLLNEAEEDAVYEEIKDSKLMESANVNINEAV